MANLNVPKLREAIEYLKRPEVRLGTHAFAQGPNGSEPCCALGHMAQLAQIDLGEVADHDELFENLSPLYGLDRGHCWGIAAANDSTPDRGRKAKVIAHLESLITQAEEAAQVG